MIVRQRARSRAGIRCPGNSCMLPNLDVMTAMSQTLQECGRRQNQRPDPESRGVSSRGQSDIKTSFGALGVVGCIRCVGHCKGVPRASVLIIREIATQQRQAGPRLHPPLRIASNCAPICQPPTTSLCHLSDTKSAVSNFSCEPERQLAARHYHSSP